MYINIKCKGYIAIRYKTAIQYTLDINSKPDTPKTESCVSKSYILTNISTW